MAAENTISGEVIARLLDITERRVQQLAREGVVVKATRGQYDLVGSVQGYIRYLRGKIAEPETIVTDLNTERTRLASAQSIAQELKNEETAGRLLDRDEVVQTWTTRITAAKSKLRAIPKQLRTRVPKFTVKMAKQTQRMIDEALDELSVDGVQKGRSDRRGVARDS